MQPRRARQPRRRMPPSRPVQPGGWVQPHGGSARSNMPGFAPAVRLGSRWYAAAAGGGCRRRVRMPAAGMGRWRANGPHGVTHTQCPPAGAAFPPSRRGGRAGSAHGRDIRWSRGGRHGGRGSRPSRAAGYVASFASGDRPAVARRASGGRHIAMPALLQFDLRSGGFRRCTDALGCRGGREGGLRCRWAPDTVDRPSAAAIAALPAARQSAD
mmetsp:Transcript_26913/g.86969  ORF Transcript_26913/g.86969 Transcript_26913/m.86969 type:complete len:213 (+) Transcript_26913:301-939(+)